MPGPIRDFLLDANMNRVLVGPNYALAADIAAVGQGAKVRVQLFLGEVWYNTQLGVPWIQEILIKNPVEIVVKGDISRAIADTPDITQVVATSYSIDGRTRQGEVSYSANSPYGIVSSKVTLP